MSCLLLPGIALLLANCDAGHTEPARAKSGQVSFTDVTAEAGLANFRHENGGVGKKWYPEMMGSGAGFFDYNGDGWLDILLLGGGTWELRPTGRSRAVALYRNEGDGTFTDQTSAAGLDEISAYTLGMAAADYDNDGDQDFVVSNLGRDMLFRNDEGTFVEVGVEAGIGVREEWGSSAVFFDADRDGHLDIFVGQYVRWTPETDKWCPEGSAVKLYCVPADYEGIASRYYHNNGDGTFTDRTEEAGFITGDREVREKALGVVDIDFNDDGWTDLYVATDGEGNLLYENNRDGTFTERGVRSGVAFSEHGEARAGMGVDAGVVDSTGQTSLVVGNFSEEPISVYQHVGSGLFLDRSAASKMSQPSYLTLTFGLFLFDVDLDGDLDLFAANGHVNPDRLADSDRITFKQPAQLFLNAGDGTFTDVTQEIAVLNEPMVARGAAFGDYDRDGDLDILLTENDGPAHLWRNDLENRSFVRVSLQGRERSALGSKITAKIGGHIMERRIRTGSSYLSQSEPTATFGLGSAAEVDSLVIRWPSGQVDRFANVAANQEIRVTESEGTWERVEMAAGQSLAVTK